jgi:hypothetical protein
VREGLTDRRKAFWVIFCYNYALYVRNRGQTSVLAF